MTLRLAVNVAVRRKTELGLNPTSATAAFAPDAEGEPWF